MRLKYVHLAQLHFRLTITRPDTLPALLFNKLNSSLPLSNLHTPTLDYPTRYATHAFRIDLQTDPLPDMTSQPPKNRERAFRNLMRKIISDLWKGNSTTLLAHMQDNPLGERLHTFIFCFFLNILFTHYLGCPLSPLK